MMKNNKQPRFKNWSGYLAVLGTLCFTTYALAAGSYLSYSVPRNGLAPSRTINIPRNSISVHTYISGPRQAETVLKNTKTGKKYSYQKGHFFNQKIKPGKYRHLLVHPDTGPIYPGKKIPLWSSVTWKDKSKSKKYDDITTIPKPKKPTNPKVTYIPQEHWTGKHWQLRFADFDRDGRDDLFAINRSSGGKVHVNIASQSSNFQTIIFTGPTRLPAQTNNVWLDAADFDNDGIADLILIEPGAKSKKTDITILSGESKFNKIILSLPTSVGAADNTARFDLADYDGDGILDLFLIAGAARSGRTELHVLSGATNFQKVLVSLGTVLPNVDESGFLRVGHYDHDSVPDLFLINPGTGSKTQVTIVGGGSSYQKQLLHHDVALPSTDWSAWFELSNDNAIRPDIALINTTNSAKKTAVLFATGATKYKKSKGGVNTVIKETVGTHQVK